MFLLYSSGKTSLPGAVVYSVATPAGVADIRLHPVGCILRFRFPFASRVTWLGLRLVECCKGRRKKRRRKRKACRQSHRQRKRRRISALQRKTQVSPFRHLPRLQIVGDTGFEPVTSTMSTWLHSATAKTRSSTIPTAYRISSPCQS